MSPTKAQLGRKKKRKVNGTALLHFSFNKLTKIHLISHRFFILIPNFFVYYYSLVFHLIMVAKV